MKYLKLRDLLFFITIAALIIIGCQSETGNSEMETDSVLIENQMVIFDSIMAKELKADDYGMKKYVMAFLKRGPNRTQDSTEAEELQRAHLDNIDRLAKEGKLILAGPFIDESDIRGIYIFNVETVEEAEKLTNTDPAIKAGRLIMELHPWYGSAAIQKINELHKSIAKEEI